MSVIVSMFALLVANWPFGINKFDLIWFDTMWNLKCSLPTCCHWVVRKKLLNLSYLNCGLQIRQIWSSWLQRVGNTAREGVQNTDLKELKERLRAEWAKQDHVVIAAAVRQWRRRQSASVRLGRWWTKHFEQRFWFSSLLLISVSRFFRFRCWLYKQLRAISRLILAYCPFPFWRCDAVIAIFSVCKVKWQHW